MKKILTIQKQVQIEINKNLKIIGEFNRYMERLTDTQKRLAECVGLWLAEGGNKSKSEITFTNSCLDLVDLFKRTINKIFKDYKYNQRIYVYSRNGEKTKLPYEDCVIKYYVHKRATKPFLIFRIASVKILEKWRTIVKETLETKELFPYVLRGFFAGEGNIKEASHNSRTLRISQGERKDFIDIILNNFGIEFSYELGHRNYIIYGKRNWDIFANLKLADLHPEKRKRFWEVYSHFKEEHYKTNFLIKKILPILDTPHTTKQLAEAFKRTPARIIDVLMELKKKGKIENYRAKSVDYWTNDKNLIIISKLKNRYLLFLDRPKQTIEFAKHFKVCWKSSFRRLKELNNLSLVRRQKDGKWIKLQTEKKTLAI